VAIGWTSDIAADDFVPGLPQGGDGVPPGESIATGDEDFHGKGFGVRGSGFRGTAKERLW
jgi:hypothetical protein